MWICDDREGSVNDFPKPPNQQNGNRRLHPQPLIVARRWIAYESRRGASRGIMMLLWSTRKGSRKLGPTDERDRRRGSASGKIGSLFLFVPPCLCLARLIYYVFTEVVSAPRAPERWFYLFCLPGNGHPLRYIHK